MSRVTLLLVGIGPEQARRVWATLRACKNIHGSFFRPTAVTTITVVCAWCGAGMGTKDELGVTGISHGICERCMERALKEMAGLSKM